MRNLGADLSLQNAIASVRTHALTQRRVWLLQAAGVLFFVGLMSAAAHVRLPLPFTPVPVTLQTGVVLLAGATLGPTAAGISLLLYLAAGAAGLPVLTSALLLGPTAGYLLAFLPAAVLVGWIARRWGWTGACLGMVLASALIYTGGILGLCLVTGATPALAFATGVVPFLAGDALKLLGAATAARWAVPAWQRLLRGTR